MSLELGNLQNQDYSHKEEARHQEKISGSNVAIRQIDPKDSTDMARLKRIDEFTVDDGNMSDDGLMSEKKLFKFAKSSDKDKYYIWAVSGTRQDDAAKETQGDLDEVGEMQGWVTIRKLEKEQIDYLKKSGIIIDDPKNTWEISYAVFPDSQSTAKGKMTYGAIHSIVDFASHKYGNPTEVTRIEKAALKIVDYIRKKIGRKGSLLEDKQEKLQQITLPTIVAYTNVRNARSSSLLERVKFAHVGQAYYDKEEEDDNNINDVWILDQKEFDNLVRESFLPPQK